MKWNFKEIQRNRKGFTLVELLIVFTLLGMLAAIVIPSVAGVVNYGQSQAASAEKSIIQAAMDSMMAKDNVATVNITTDTSDMSAFPVGQALYPNYLRFNTSKGNYSTDNTGLVLQTDTGY